MGPDQIIARTAELLWTGALAATPIAIAVGALCRCRGVRFPPRATSCGVAVLASFITPAVGSLLWKPHWFRSDRLIAAADSVLTQEEAAESGSPTRSSIHAAQMPRRPDAPTTQLREPARVAEESPSIGTATVAAPAVFAAHPIASQAEAPQPVADKPTEPTVSPLLCSNDPAPSAPSAMEMTVVGSDEREPSITDNFVWDRSTSRSPAWRCRASSTPTPRPCLNQPQRCQPSPRHPSFSLNRRQRQVHPQLHAAKTPNNRSLRQWLVRVLNVRDALADVPPVPPSLWFGGAVLVVALSIWRRCMGMLWLRSATPAGPHVQAVVRQGRRKPSAWPARRARRVRRSRGPLR